MYLSFLLEATDVFATLLLSGAFCFTPLVTLPHLVGGGEWGSDLRRPVSFHFFSGVLCLGPEESVDGTFFSND